MDSAILIDWLQVIGIFAFIVWIARANGRKLIVFCGGKL